MTLHPTTLPDAPALRLGDGEAHVWLASVAAHAHLAGPLRHTLDADETARAARFHAARDRERHVIAHGLLRSILAVYAGAEPAALRFAAGSFGKPSLREPWHALEFNMSHSDDLIAVAVARGEPVGVDVERWADFDYDEVARGAFSARERAALGALPPGAKQRAFFETWTRKEAYIKATGHGVARGLHHFDVSLGTDSPAALLEDRMDAHATGTWCMHAVDAGVGYSGALVTSARVTRVDCFAVLQPMFDGVSRR